MFRGPRGARSSSKHPAIAGASKAGRGFARSKARNAGVDTGRSFKAISETYKLNVGDVAHLFKVFKSQFSYYINQIRIYIYTVHKIAGKIDRVKIAGNIDRMTSL